MKQFSHNIVVMQHFVYSSLIESFDARKSTHDFSSAMWWRSGIFIIATAPRHRRLKYFPVTLKGWNWNSFASQVTQIVVTWVKGLMWIQSCWIGTAIITTKEFLQSGKMQCFETVQKCKYCTKITMIDVIWDLGFILFLSDSLLLRLIWFSEQDFLDNIF